jgi:hypothetical protein
MGILQLAKEALARARQERNSVLTQYPVYAINAINAESPPSSGAAPEWDADRAADVLADCERFLDDALAASSLTAPRRTVADVLRSVVRTHAAQRDPQLWNDLDFLTEQFGEWRKRLPAPSPVPFQSVPRDASWWATGDEPDLLELVKGLFPPNVAAPKVSDWRLTR